MGKDDKLKLVDFNKAKEEQEKLPDVFIEKLELLLQKAKEGKLRTLVAHFDFGSPAENKEGDVVGGTLLWNHTHNPLELIGVAEIIKTIAVENTMVGHESE